MNRVALLFAVVLLPVSVTSQGLSSNMVVDFPTGDGPGELGFYSRNVGSEIPYCPRTLRVHADAIYIGDIWNSRVSVFDLDGNHIEDYPVNEGPRYLASSYDFRIGENRFVLLNSYYGLVIIDKETGENESLGRDGLRREVGYYRNFFLHEGNLILLNDNREYCVYSLETGERLLSEEREIIESLPARAFSADPLLNEAFFSFADDRNIPVLDGEMLNCDFEIHRELFEYLRQRGFGPADDFDLDSNGISVMRMVGRDDDQNYCWRGLRGTGEIWFVVTSKTGAVLAAFRNPFGNRSFSVSSAGDVYHLNYSPEGIELWRTDRYW